MNRTPVTTGLAALALTALLGACTVAKTGVVAASAPDQVTVLPLLYGSATTVTFTPSTVAALKGLGVTVGASGSAMLAADGTAASFPITSGYAEVHLQHAVKPGWIQGSISHTGSGLTLRSGPTTVRLTDFTVDPGNSVLYATVNGALPQVPLLSLDGANVTETTDSTGAVVLDGTVAKLTDAAAGALNQAFATTALTAGTPLGTVHLVAAGQPVTYDASKDQVTALSRLTGQSTSVAIDAGTAGALQQLGVTLTPLGSATLDQGSSTLRFPITGGMVAIHSVKAFNPGYVLGTILHQGSGLGITGPNGATVTTSDYVVDPGGSNLYATVNGKPGVDLLTLDGSKLTVSQSGGAVHLDGTVARLSGLAATALDQAFGTDALKAGVPLGVVHIVATGQPGS